jgi:hypothetical protein
VGKNWQICKRGIVARILAAAVSLTVAFGVQPAGAQTSRLPQVEAQQRAAQSVTVPAAYCKQSSLTGPIFLNLLNTIVKHDDLTDIAFLEKTLGTKLSVLPALGPGPPDKDDLAVFGDSVLGSPIAVQVKVIRGKDVQAAGGIIAEVDFRSSSLAINCLRLTSADFASLFGQLSGMWTGGYDVGEGWIKPKTTEKNGVKLEISFGWNCHCTDRSTLQTERITDVTLKEFQ